MANHRVKNPTTKKYNRMIHALNSVRSGRCPVHQSLVRGSDGEHFRCTADACCFDLIKKDGHFQLSPSSEKRFAEVFG